MPRCNVGSQLEECRLRVRTHPAPQHKERRGETPRLPQHLPHREYSRHQRWWFCTPGIKRHSGTQMNEIFLFLRNLCAGCLGYYFFKVHFYFLEMNCHCDACVFTFYILFVSMAKPCEFVCCCSSGILGGKERVPVPPLPRARFACVENTLRIYKWQ